MDINDALTVTFLGIGVVFIGLILTSLMIKSFSLIPKVAKLFQKSPSVATANAEGTSRSVAVSTLNGPVTPEIMAVITSVLEVELRLRESLTEGKFTFKY